MATPSDTAGNRPAQRRRPVQTIASLVGVVFLLVGILGFIPGITTGYGDLRFGGPHSEAMLFGVFGVSVLHNLVHLLFGVAGVAASWKRGVSRAFLMVGGGVYLVLWVYGVTIDQGRPENFVPFNTADNWLHLGLGIGMIVAGVAATALEKARGQYPSREPMPESS
jgi:hypothetical protein